MESEPYDITLSYTSYTCGVGAQLLLFLKKIFSLIFWNNCLFLIIDCVYIKII